MDIRKALSPEHTLTKKAWSNTLRAVR
jgi:hypothetical protein